MTSDDDKFWESMVEKLRRASGFCSPTPEEAEAEMDAEGDEPMSEETLASILDLFDEYDSDFLNEEYLYSDEYDEYLREKKESKHIDEKKDSYVIAPPIVVYYVPDNYIFISQSNNEVDMGKVLDFLNSLPIQSSRPLA